MDKDDIQESAEHKLELAMTDASGMEDAELAAQLPDMTLPTDASTEAAAAAMDATSERQPPSDDHHVVELSQVVHPQHGTMELPEEQPGALELAQSLESTTELPQHHHEDSTELPQTEQLAPSMSTGANQIVTGATADDQAAVAALDADELDTPTRPLKRRRGGRRVSNPNMSAEERRRQRVLKNRESAMRSLAKKAEYAQKLAETQKVVLKEQLDKQLDLRKLVDSAVELRDELTGFDSPSFLDLVASLSDCVNRCNLALSPQHGDELLVPIQPPPSVTSPAPTTSQLSAVAHIASNSQLPTAGQLAANGQLASSAHHDASAQLTSAQLSVQSPIVSQSLMPQ